METSVDRLKSVIERARRLSLNDDSKMMMSSYATYMEENKTEEKYVKKNELIYRSNQSKLPVPCNEFVNQIESSRDNLLEEKLAETDVRVVSVIGLGGLGKMTLARLIYPEYQVFLSFRGQETIFQETEILGKCCSGFLETEIKLLSRCYSAGYINSKDFGTRCMARKRREMIKEWLSAVFVQQRLKSFRFCPKELENFVNNNGKMVDNPGNHTLLSPKTVSLPSQVSSSPSNRNRKKRLKKKLKNKAKREEIDNNLSRSNTCLLYMFASMYTGGYLLYRIDALEHTRISHENNELLPLLVFGPDILPDGFCTLVHMKDYIYFVGEKPYDVFKIQKLDLKNLKPAEDNLGLEYLIPIKQPMQGPKRSPLVFVANENLYVISLDCSNSHEFETYSPTNNSWKDLNPKPKGHGYLKSHVVVDNVAYFATTDETVLCYNLTDGIWSIVSTAPKYPRNFCDIHPAFDAPVEIVGNMILGAFKLPSDFNITVAASPHSRCSDSVKDSFMRPTLAPDNKFWPEFARRFDYIRNSKSYGSHYMTALQTLDGQNILCFVSYGSHPSTDEPHRSYALLTFYKIPGSNRKTSVRLNEEVLEAGDSFCYYSRQVEAGNAIKSYFDSEFMQRKLFNISTTRLCTVGKLITCVAF